MFRYEEIKTNILKWRKYISNIHIYNNDEVWNMDEYLKINNINK